MGVLISQLGLFEEGTALNDVIDDEDEPIVAAALQGLGLPMVAVQRLKPWMVGLQMSLLQIQQAGYDPASGVETILTAEAREAGKSIVYLETLEEQLNFLAAGDIEDQVEALIFTAQTAELGASLLDSLVNEWADGDIAGLGAIVANPEAIGGQEAYDTLLVNRNKNWVPEIRAMLEVPGTVFVAVGAAHLAGPDSVITMLRAEGLEVAGPG